MKFVSTASRLSKASWRNVPFVTHRFLWLPLTINGETRWLEKPKVRWRICFTRGIFDNYHEWYPNSFID